MRRVLASLNRPRPHPEEPADRPASRRMANGEGRRSVLFRARRDGHPSRRSLHSLLRVRIGGALLLMLLAAPALAVEPDEVLADKALEARARTISAEVRCVVCQNQSIDDSSAEIARDMRRAIRERLTAGDSDPQVIAFLRARYGDYVLLKPPFDLRTWLMWLGGPLALLLAGVALWRGARRAQTVTPRALTDDEQVRLKTLLRDDREAR